MMKRLTLLLLAFGAGIAPAQSGMETPSPLVRNYTSKEYRAGTQNWCLTRHSNGFLYVGNTKGILEYDGKSWRLIKINDDASIRSLFSDPASGRIYVGATGELGYLAPDRNGKMNYHSLKKHLKKEDQAFAEVWTTFVTPKGVYYYTDYALMKWDGQQFHLLKPENPKELFYACIYVNNTIYLHIENKGLCKVVNGKIELVSDGAQFARDGIISIVQYDYKHILFRAGKKGLFLHDGQRAMPFTSPDIERIRPKTIYQIRKLRNGDFALATILDGVYIINPQGQLKQHFNQENGLKDNQVIYLLDDEEGNLWMGLMSGIAVTQYPNPITYIPENKGYSGGAIALASFENKLYIGTFDGLYEMTQKGVERSFRRIPNISNIVYDLNVEDHSLWISTQNGVFQLKNGNIRKLTTTAATATCHSKRDTNLMYMGTWMGMTALRRKNGTWVEDSAVKGITHEVRSLIETPDGKLWAWLLRGGVVRLDFSKGYRQNAPFERFTTKEGLPSNVNNAVKEVNGEVVFCTEKGFYTFDEKRKRFTPHPKLNHAFPEKDWAIADILNTREGNIWVYRSSPDYVHQTGVMIRMPDGSYRYSATPFATMGDELDINDFTSDESGKVWVATMDAIVGYDARVPIQTDVAFKPVLRAVAGHQNKSFWEGISSASVPTIPHIEFADAHTIQFRLGINYLNQAQNSRYQYRLEPFDNEWSAWTSNPDITYNGLREGNYTLRIKARNVYGQVSEEVSYTFSILPPWYRTIWAYGVYTLAFGLTVWALISLRTRKLKDDQILLEARIRERTEEIEQQKRALEASHAEITIQKAELEASNKLLDSYTKQITIQKQDLEKAVEIISHKSAETERANEEISRKHALLEQKKQELEQALTDIAQAHEETRALNDQLTSLNQELTGQKSELENAFEEINAKNDQLESANQEIQRQYKLLGDHHEELLANQEELRATLERLQATQAHLVMSEKMGVLGTMMAGVAHEINTPIGAVKAAAENLHSNLPLLIPKLPQFFAKLSADDLELFFRFVDVVMKAEAVGSVAEERQIRKNVALALEAMNVAHADLLARTLSKIGVYKQLNDFDVLFKHPSAEEIVEMAGALGKMRLNTDNILTAVGKTQKIIFALRSFSHQNPSVEMIPSKIESQIPIALTLYHNTLKQGVQVITEFESDLPEIYCYPDELDQVWINLITNAVHAMNNKGELRIRVYQEQDYIKVSLSDTGPGIPQEILPRIFEPFFTTKPQGEGTGLGLHICKQIIDKHQGLISAESEPGNTTFTVSLPVRATPMQGFRAPQS